MKRIPGSESLAAVLMQELSEAGQQYVALFWLERHQLLADAVLLLLVERLLVARHQVRRQLRVGFGSLVGRCSKTDSRLFAEAFLRQRTSHIDGQLHVDVAGELEEQSLKRPGQHQKASRAHKAGAPCIAGS